MKFKTKHFLFTFMQMHFEKIWIFFFSPPLATYGLNNSKQGSLDSSSQCRRQTTLKSELWRRHCKTTFAIFLGKSLQLKIIKKESSENNDHLHLKGNMTWKKKKKGCHQTTKEWNKPLDKCVFLNWRNFHKNIYMHFQLSLWKAI